MDNLINFVIENWGYVILALTAYGFIDLEELMKKIMGFTLIELMIVIAIISILASVVLPALRDGGADPVGVQAAPTAKEQFEEHVDSDCIERYGKHACVYQ